MDAIGLAALGLKFNNLDSPTQFALAFEDVFKMERSKMSTLMSVLNIYMPIRRILPIKVNREYLAANVKIRQHLRERIRSRKLELEDKESAAGATDLLAVLLKEKISGVNAWTEDEMVNHVSLKLFSHLRNLAGHYRELTFCLSVVELHGSWYAFLEPTLFHPRVILTPIGHETTAGALTLTLFLLADHLEVQSHLREEINKAIPTPSDLNYNSVMNISYLSNVVNEVLRLYPPGAYDASRGRLKMLIFEYSNIIPQRSSQRCCD